MFGQRPTVNLLESRNFGDLHPACTAELQPHGLQGQSDSNGMYGFGSAPDGPANLRITHPLYPEQNIPVTIDSENPLTVDVVLASGPPPP